LQLQNNTLTITAGDITRALQDNIRDCLSQQQQEAVKAFEKYLHTAQTASVAALEFIKSAALKEIRKIADDKKQELLQLSQQQRTHNDDDLLNGKDLE
jgi:DNA-binding IscR family transcriptional regulator